MTKHKIYIILVFIMLAAGSIEIKLPAPPAAQAAFPGHPAEWDDEYSRLVPVDFFERNIEDIDAAMAFHMVLLQAFARHESELLRAGTLSADGKITLFTKPYEPLTVFLSTIILS